MKKILIIGMSCLLFACQPTNEIIDDQDDLHTEVENVNENTDIVEVEDTLAFDVSNNSPAFSNEDLIYFIMVDRFKDGDAENNNHPDYSSNPSDLKNYLGGDLQGVIDQMAYIKSLGTTTIWLTPIVQNEPFGYHGYWTNDFYQVDQHIGDLDKMKELVDLAHENDIKVILDYVVNHTGYNHPWLSDDSKTDWFHNNGTITDYNDIDQVENYNLSGLPDLNTENPQVKAYFFENALFWIRETGVDGMRLDTVRHVPQAFWNEFAYIIKSEYPDFYLLGEVWKNSASLLEEYHNLGIDGLTNYSMYNGIEHTFKQYGDANKLRISIQNESKFSNPELNGIFMDNHDVARLISRTSDNNDVYWQQGLTFVMTYPSIPVIYYGTEIGMDGKDDPNNRKMMDFEQVDGPYFEIYQKLLTLREATRDYKTVNVIASHKDYIGLSYSNGTDTYYTFFNISKLDHEIEVPLSGNYKDFMLDTSLTLDGSLILKPLSTLILMEE